MSGIFRKMFPAEYVRSIYDYDFDRAYSDGMRLVLFDIDNTLVPHGAPADQRSIGLIGRLKEKGFALSAVSNNKEPRVRTFCDAAGVPYICDAGKPGTRGYLEAVQRSGAAKDETIFFGDQIFTDIIGADRAGIHSVLVRPIDRSTDEIQIKLKRFIEKPVITAFFKEKGIAIGDYFN